MSRKRFIQNASMYFLPHTDWHLDKAIAYGERLWQRLEERGFGEGQPQGPRPLTDHFNQLPEAQQALFIRFWQAFGLKKGRSGAALSWLKLAPDVDLAERIIAAAARESQVQREPGQVRKMAQGWLSERRWEDYTPVAIPASRESVHNEIRAELSSLRRLAGPTPAGPLAEQIARLEAKLRGGTA